MEDKGLGNIIFYIILAIIGLAGSFQNKKKKVPGQPPPRKPAPKPVQEQPRVEVPRRPQPVFAEPVDEGHYAEPMARQFSAEGSIESSMAAAFASEGIRGMTELQMKAEADTTISDSEITDAPVYDYDSRDDDRDLLHSFDLKKAVIYSAILERREYKF
ncbi:MAG: hypothetical protein MUC70_04625 [Bacteroidales bacterium]|nr:hypothetical protein [Bacteroidales bacterium]